MVRFRAGEKKLPSFETVQAKVEKDHQITFFSQDQIRVTSRDIFIYSKIFGMILRQYSPEVIFQLCFYSTSNYGHNLAARKKATSIDFQHGNVSSTHPAYAIPGNQNVLPDKFWLWDEYSFRNMLSWSQDRLILGGNPWIESFRSSRKKLLFIDENKPSILYTLQPIDTVISQYELETISITQGKYNWLIRIHPRQKAEINQISEILKQNKIEKFNITDSSTLPIPLLLKYCDVHITKFSSTALEATSFGVHTILTDVRGKNYYQELIDDGNATFVKDPGPRELMSTIDRVLKMNKTTSENFNIQTRGALLDLGLIR